jgi:transcriptional regulator with XRE-family HTH domain
LTKVSDICHYTVGKEHNIKMNIDDFLKLSYRQLEKITDIDKSNWSKYFNGKLSPNWRTVVNISERIQTSPLEAMRFIETRKEQNLDNSCAK